MRRALVALIVLAAATTAAGQGVADPITWALAVQPAGATTTAGGKITLGLTATIEEGWHLYSIKLEPGGPVPTSITIPDGQPFSLAGDIAEPLPASSFDGNFSKILEYHENKAVFTIPMKAAASAAAGKQTARVSISYQTCNDRLCLPPRQVAVTADVQLVK
jgi:thiol:disulfide interchange protein DsbD